jgi:DNA ligase (NAD+)
LDNATISDFDFDTKLRQLQDLENAYPEFYKFALRAKSAATTKNFKTVPHDYRMYSLDNSYSKEDLIDWEKEFRRF